MKFNKLFIHAILGESINERKHYIKNLINIKENGYIRNLQARILRIDGAELNLIGQSVINLLIKVNINLNMGV